MDFSIFDLPDVILISIRSPTAVSHAESVPFMEILDMETSLRNTKKSFRMNPKDDDVGTPTAL